MYCDVEFFKGLSNLLNLKILDFLVGLSDKVERQLEEKSCSSPTGSIWSF